MKVMATGAFDLLHPGHGLYLEKAKELGGEDAVLVVVIARDSTVKKKKRIPGSLKRTLTFQTVTILTEKTARFSRRYLMKRRKLSQEMRRCKMNPPKCIIQEYITNGYLQRKKPPLSLNQTPR